MLDFIPQDPPQPVVPNGQDIPKELDLFFKLAKDFLPEGKTIKDLTPEELIVLKDQYKYSPYIPGLYQQITGIKGSI